MSPSKAKYIPVTAGFTKSARGYSVDADNEQYNTLYDKVMKDEREQRIGLGLPPEEPGFWEKMKETLHHHHKSGHGEDGMTSKKIVKKGKEDDGCDSIATLTFGMGWNGARLEQRVENTKAL